MGCVGWDLVGGLVGLVVLGLIGAVIMAVSAGAVAGA